LTLENTTQNHEREPLVGSSKIIGADYQAFGEQPFEGFVPLCDGDV
jgi:hypothetical protein